MKKLRYYQVENATKGVDILRLKNIVYLVMEVRTGKTATSLEIAKLFGAKKVLFLTKKKAIKSIENDYHNFGYIDCLRLTIINDESLHTIDDNFDLVIHDEHHRFGAFPKMGKYANMFKDKYSKLPMIFLSGTPTPESKMQWINQFGVSKYSPFGQYNFYTTFKNLGFKAYKFDLGFGLVNNYSSSLDTIYKYYSIEKRSIKKDYIEPNLELVQIKIREQQDIDNLNKSLERLESIVKPYLVTYTQQEAGFTSSINEHFLTVPMKEVTYKLCNKLIRDRVIVGSSQTILADTAVKLQGKLHQLYSGTIKFEDGSSKIIDDSKALFIKEYFKNKKIGIFYKFKEEYILLKSIFCETLTNDINEFDTTDKNIALQIVSGREGISLKNADYLVFFNIDFSATSYFQARDRLTTMDRLTNDIYWVFSQNGIEEKIYQAVSKKKDFTLNVFKKHYNV